VDTASGTEYPGSNPTRLYISFNHGNVDVLNLCVEKEKQRHLPKFIRKKNKLDCNARKPCMYVGTFVPTYVCMYICIYVSKVCIIRMYVCTYIRMYICMYVHMSEHIFVCPLLI
jgi:hypothetical protein